jgi:4-diphosphocytidyl-2-C-methyl-D-erythritol kinase
VIIDSIKISSYAKVNLTLDVLGVRPDGFHAIESVMQSIGLCDAITLTKGLEPGIGVTCTMPGIPTDERNLVHKAASILLQECGVEPALRIDIEKSIPAQAGLGGGSSNAAAVLIGLTRLLKLAIDHKKLEELSARVGSDVPFFLTGGTAHVLGRGEDVRSLPDLQPRWMVIVKPPFGISTAWSYRRIDAMRKQAEVEIADPGSASEKLVACIEKEGCGHLAELLRNDLEAPAIEQHPEIEEIKKSLRANGAEAALMCGSGSAVFGIFTEENTASNALEKLSGHGKGFLCATVARKKLL